MSYAHNAPSTLLELLDSYVQKQPYIPSEDHSSYIFWWRYMSQPREVLHPRENQAKVSNTIHFPDGTTETYEWYAQHGRRYHWSWKRTSFEEVDKEFRKGHSKGNVKGKGRKSDSFNRTEKTKQFRKNDKYPCRWPIGGSARTFWVKQCNRDDRRLVKAQIRRGDWDRVKDWQDPVNKWLWS